MTALFLSIILMLLAAGKGQNLRLDSPTDIFSAINSFTPDSSSSSNAKKNQPDTQIPQPSQPSPLPETFNDVKLLHHLPATFVVGEVFHM